MKGNAKSPVTQPSSGWILATPRPRAWFRVRCRVCRVVCLEKSGCLTEGLRETRWAFRAGQGRDGRIHTQSSSLCLLLVILSQSKGTKIAVIDAIHAGQPPREESSMQNGKMCIWKIKRAGTQHSCQVEVLCKVSLKPTKYKQSLSQLQPQGQFCLYTQLFSVLVQSKASTLPL